MLGRKRQLFSTKMMQSREQDCPFDSMRKRRLPLLQLWFWYRANWFLLLGTYHR
jgi:hypothetical protein